MGTAAREVDWRLDQAARGWTVAWIAAAVPRLLKIEGHLHAEPEPAAGTETRLTALLGPEMPHFNPMRVLTNRVVREFEGREDQRPAATSAQPVIGTTALLGETLALRRFSSFVPMPTATGHLEEMPQLVGQELGLIRAIEPAATIICAMMAEAVRIT